jgi:hypothetical protein
VKGVTEIAKGQRETLAALTNLGEGLRALSNIGGLIAESRHDRRLSACRRRRRPVLCAAVSLASLAAAADAVVDAFGVEAVATHQAGARLVFTGRGSLALAASNLTGAPAWIFPHSGFYLISHVLRMTGKDGDKKAKA